MHPSQMSAAAGTPLAHTFNPDSLFAPPPPMPSLPYGIAQNIFSPHAFSTFSLSPLPTTPAPALPPTSATAPYSLMEITPADPVAPALSSSSATVAAMTSSLASSIPPFSLPAQARPAAPGSENDEEALDTEMKP